MHRGLPATLADVAANCRRRRRLILCSYCDCALAIVDGLLEGVSRFGLVFLHPGRVLPRLPGLGVPELWTALHVVLAVVHLGVRAREASRYLLERPAIRRDSTPFGVAPGGARATWACFLDERRS